MVSPKIVKSVQDYLNYVNRQGVSVRYGVLFGSHVTGRADTWSDIDLLVIAPDFDQTLTHQDYESLWIYAGRTDSRIEPIPVGEKQFAEDRSNPILEIARREGQVIPLAE